MLDLDLDLSVRTLMGRGCLLLVPQGGVSSIWISQQVPSVSRPLGRPYAPRQDWNERGSSQALTYTCRELAYVSVISELLIADWHGRIGGSSHP